MASTSRERRTRLDVIASILNACQYGTKKTHVMYLCNLSFKQLAGYLGLLLHANLILIENDRQSVLLKVSRKGKDFLRAYDDIKAMME